MSCALKKAGIPYAINASSHFYDETTDQWIPEMVPILNAVLRPDCSKISYPSEIIISLSVGSPVMELNGVKQEVDPGRGTKPVIIPKWGRTIVPVRAIVEALGGLVNWNPVQRMVTIELNGTTIKLWIEKPQAEVNGVMKWIDPNNHDVKPIIVNGRTMLPLRFVAESLGCTVNWDSSLKTITIMYRL